MQEDHENDKDTHVQDLSPIDGNNAADDDQDTKSGYEDQYLRQGGNMLSPIRRCVNKPRTRGTRMTFMTVMAIAIKETSTHWPARPQTMKGIIMGANNVEQVVMETDKGTSALARNPMTFDAVPLGQEPRRIMPTAISGGISKARTRAYASSGIIV